MGSFRCLHLCEFRMVEFAQLPIFGALLSNTLQTKAGGRAMLDVSGKTDVTNNKPRIDLQSHLRDLEEKGLLLRIERPINKDTELHPLVRWQFVGGIPVEKRRAFLFTNVIDSKGRRYDMPVVVGALSAAPQIYARGMGRKVEEIGDVWLKAIQRPIPPVRVNTASCQEVVITGEALKQKG